LLRRRLERSEVKPKDTAEAATQNVLFRGDKKEPGRTSGSSNLWVQLE